MVFVDVALLLLLVSAVSLSVGVVFSMVFSSEVASVSVLRVDFELTYLVVVDNKIIRRSDEVILTSVIVIDLFVLI